MPVPTKVAFIKFRHRRDAAVALHLTNAVLVDKLIQVIPWREGIISYNNFSSKKICRRDAN